MSIGFGSSGGGTRLTDKAKVANDMLLTSIDPSNPNTQKYMSQGYKDAVAAGTEFGGYYQGADGVGTFTSDGRYIPPGSSERLPTTLPGYEALARYDTLWGNYDNGTLSPTQSAIMGNAAQILTGNTAGSGGYYNDLMNSGRLGGASLSGGGGGVPAPPDFANRTLNVDNIGALVGDIFQDMPPEFRDFTINMLNAADESTVEASITDFTNKMMDFVNMASADAGRQTLDVYAAQGLGNSGAAVAGLVDVAVRVTTEASARVAEYALTRYDQAIKKMGIAQQIQSDYLQAGANEQANRVQYEIGKLQAEASAYGSYAQAQAQVQSTLINANTRIQEQLISSAASLEGQRMAYQNAQLSNMYGENQAANQQRTNALLLPYQTLQNTQGITKTKNPNPGSGIGGLGELATGIADIWTVAK